MLPAGAPARSPPALSAHQMPFSGYCGKTVPGRRCHLGFSLMSALKTNWTRRSKKGGKEKIINLGKIKKKQKERMMFATILGQSWPVCQRGNGSPKRCGQQWPGTGQVGLSSMAVPLPWCCRPLVAMEAVRCHCRALGLMGPTSTTGIFSHPSVHCCPLGHVLIPMLMPGKTWTSPRTETTLQW